MVVPRVETGRARPVELAKHDRVGGLVFAEAPQGRFEAAGHRLSQQGAEHGLGQGLFEEQDLLVDVQALELVVAEALGRREARVDRHVEQRGQRLGQEGALAVDRHVTGAPGS